MIDSVFNKKKLFPEDLLDNNWPFSLIFAEELVEYNGFHYCSSLKTFLLNTAIAADSDEESDTDYVDNGNLVDSNFHLMDGKVYYDHLSLNIPEGCQVNEERVSEETTNTMYCMDNISYDSLMCEAIKFLMKCHIEESEYKDDLLGLQIATTCYVWSPISQLLLYTRYSFFVKNLIKEKKYMERFQVELMACSYRRAVEMRDKKEFYTFFLLEKIISPKERLLNLLSFSTLSKDTRERLVDTIFKRNSFQEMISYYEEALSGSDYL